MPGEAEVMLMWVDGPASIFATACLILRLRPVSFGGPASGSSDGRARSPSLARTLRAPTCTSASDSLRDVITPSALMVRRKTRSPNLSVPGWNLLGHGLARRRLLDLLLQNFHLLFDSLDGIQRLAGLFHLFLQRVDLLLQDGDFQLAFRAGFFEHLPAFVFDVLQSFFQLEPRRVRALLGLLGFLAFAAGLVALAADVVQHLVGAQVERIDLTSSRRR